MKSSNDELARALRDLAWLEHTFPQGLAHRDMHLRFHVLSALLERCSLMTAGATVIDALGHLITQRASAFTADFEWGPILLWVFPDRQAKLAIRDEDILPLPKRLNTAQRVVLHALTKKSDIWNRRSGNAYLGSGMHSYRKIASAVFGGRRTVIWSMFARCGVLQPTLESRTLGRSEFSKTAGWKFQQVKGLGHARRPNAPNDLAI